MSSAVAGPAPAPWQPAVQLDLDCAPDADGVTRLVGRRVRYPYAMLKPFWFEDRPPGIATIPLQSASGGLFAGERLHQRVRVRVGGAVHVTTQAAAIVHGADQPEATTQQVDLELEPKAYLEYIPEPMVLFPSAALAQTIVAKLAADATLVYGDGFVAHDPDAGSASFHRLQSDLEIRAPDGRLWVADRMAVSGDDFLRSLGLGGVSRCGYGVMLVAAPGGAERHAALETRLNTTVFPHEKDAARAVYGAASLLPDARGVLCRFIARDGRALRDTLEACWRATRAELSGAPAPPRRK